MYVDMFFLFVCPYTRQQFFFSTGCTTHLLAAVGFFTAVLKNKVTHTHIYNREHTAVVAVQPHSNFGLYAV